MRARLILALLSLAVACKGKSDDAKRETTGGAAGSGSAAATGSGNVAMRPDPVGGEKRDDERRDKVGASAPDEPTKVAVSDGFQAAPAPGGTTPARPAAGGSAAPGPSTAPAVPTPVTREDAIAAAPARADVTTAGAVAIVEATALDESTLTTDAVTTKIRSAYTPVIRRCAAGKSGAVSIALTVNESGRVGEVTSGATFDRAVAACIVEKAKFFVFRVPTSTATMNPARARFAMTFQLRAP